MSQSQSRDRDAVLIAHRCRRGELLQPHEVLLLAEAVLHHCSGAVPVMVAAPDDRTMPVSGAVLGSIDADAELSDGVIEDASDDSPTSARLDHTAMVRGPGGTAMVVKRGSSPFTLKGR